ncbi:golgin subfamily A member 2-like isoform X2 [Stegodyphus dumicola]|uniref:golgin subfamily A member 2-like isoform X2 n=1 Tax=Stegodyphus dumicola TaxID=202533 RepID=UPI0015A8E619|nr:golgin subfamily A member 2-like isoform X2 [Stegodyphus dumicola]
MFQENGLLKQFQQQKRVRQNKICDSDKTKITRKKASPLKDDSSFENSASKGTVSEPSAVIQQEVPSTRKSNGDLEQSKNKSSSSSALNDNASSNDIQESTHAESFNSGEIPKSKSDLALNNLKELSSTESLRQISLHLNGLMSETDAFMNGSIEQDEQAEFESKSLEKRNQELAQLVNNLQQSNDQLEFQLQDLRAKNKRLLQNFELEKKELLEKSHKEQVSLKDQLQVHIQTIGILVAEKTELQSSLSLSQQTAKQKAGEVEELQGRLRASRQRASDLERDLIALTNSNQQLEKVNKEALKDIERLKMDIYKASKSSEDLKLANAELTEKLNKKIAHLETVEKELAECQNKLSVVEVQAQQFSENNNENPSQLEEVYQQKFELEKRISLYKESIDKLINERDQMSEQYQQYIQQLSQQVTSLRDEIKQLSNEKNALSKEKNILQEKLETQQHSKDALNADPSELRKKLEAELCNNSKTATLLQEQEKKILELEKVISRLKEDEVDKSRLVETMQSDKVAASRAVAQNRELKKQLEELQSGFVSMSNDKLELAEKLHSEQHITKELGERLSQQEEELHELKEQLAQREAELQDLHKSNTKGIYQQNQIADRMRHYEAQGQLVEMLQKELHQAQEQINSLVSQNSELRMAIATQAEVTVSDENAKEDRDATKRNDLVASLSASVRQLEMERNQMMKQLEEQKNNRTNLEQQLKKREIQLSEGSEANGDVVSQEEYNLMKSAMTQLEERFKQTMNKIAELSDERQQLEHLVTQLQGETETIGDYIALYQIQRGLMRKRASEKDEYIAQLARDREDLKAKLGQLQNLVMKLLEERKQFQTQTSPLDKNLELIQIPELEERKIQNPDQIDGQNQNERESSVDYTSGSTDVEVTKKPEATAKKIMELLTEIETTNLVEKPVLDNFHPCPVCSGRLITV